MLLNEDLNSLTCRAHFDITEFWTFLSYECPQCLPCSHK
jgi:hypothetical protein